MNKREVYWIAFYSSFNKKHGYNKTLGGEGVTGRKLSKEQKDHLRRINLGKKYSDEKKEKHRISSTGRKFPNRKKIPNSGTPLKQVIDLNSGFIFDSIRQAAAAIGINVSTFRAILKGRIVDSRFKHNCKLLSDFS